jgi:CRISPR-associated protein Cas1
MAKIYNQRTLLSQYLRSRSFSDEIKEEFYKAIDKMGKYIEEIKNLFLPKDILKAEAEAAKHYWNCFKYLVNAEFKERKKRFDEPKDPVNACLNYGYSILGSQVWRAVEIKGLDPYGGYLHVDSPRRPALVMDLMEEFRQAVVDRVVIRFINSLSNENILEKGMIKNEYRKKLVSMIFQRLEEKITFEEKRITIMDHINRQVTKLSEFLLDRRNSYTPFIEK